MLCCISCLGPRATARPAHACHAGGCCVHGSPHVSARYGVWVKVVVMIDQKTFNRIDHCRERRESWPKLPSQPVLSTSLKGPESPAADSRGLPALQVAAPGDALWDLPRTASVGTTARSWIYCRTQTHNRLRLPSRLPTRPSITLRGPKAFSSSQKPLSALASARSPRRTETRAAKTAGQDGGLRNMAEGSPLD